MRLQVATYPDHVDENLEWVYGTEPKVVPVGDALWIETFAISPPSRVGQRVMVFVPPEVVTGLLRELRSTAIRARQLRHDPTP